MSASGSKSCSVSRRGGSIEGRGALSPSSKSSESDDEVRMTTSGARPGRAASHGAPPPPRPPLAPASNDMGLVSDAAKDDSHGASRSWRARAEG